MFESVTWAAVAALPAMLAEMPVGSNPSEAVDRLRLAAELKAAAAALEAKVAVALGESAMAAAVSSGRDVERAERNVVGQVALARRESPGSTRRWLGCARVLVRDLPNTFAALQRGAVPERRTMIVAAEAGWLDADHRRTVDAELGPRLSELGDRAAQGEARRIGYRLDPYGTVKRRAKAEADRRVTIRPAPDAMAWLTALLPVGRAVGVYAALKRDAATAVGIGDLRTHAQVMADTLVERVTGQAQPDAVGVEINLVMTDKALFGGDYPGDSAGEEPAVVHGYGPIPAELARRIVHAAPAERAWVRRLYTRVGRLVAMDSRHRLFKGQLRDGIVLRDQYCRMPYCGAPIRHADHAVDAADGGDTSFANGQGLCQACNYLKNEPGWTTTPSDGSGTSDEVIITTPTGHTYSGRPPDLPGAPPHLTEAVARLTSLELQRCRSAA